MRQHTILNLQEKVYKKNEFLKNSIIKKHNDYLNRYLNKWILNGIFWPKRNKALEKIIDIIQKKIKERKKEIFISIKYYRIINFLSLDIKKESYHIYIMVI